MIGILYDNISGNSGDVAIGISVRKILTELGVGFEELFPRNFDPASYAHIVIGGGDLIRRSPDFFYDAFKLGGPHVLNAAGIVGSPDDLDYLEAYEYVSVRSRLDRAKLDPLGMEVHVVPCTTLLLEDLKDPPLVPETPSVGIHLLPRTFRRRDEDRFVAWASRLPFRLYLVPITHHNRDSLWLARIAERMPNAVLLPVLKPLEIFTFLGRLDYFISGSLHGAIFAYAHNVPFLSCTRGGDKISAFMEDRGLDAHTFSTPGELERAFERITRSPPDYSSLLSRDRASLREHVERLGEILAPSGRTKVAFRDETRRQESYQVQALQSEVRALRSLLRDTRTAERRRRSGPLARLRGLFSRGRR